MLYRVRDTPGHDTQWAEPQDQKTSAGQSKRGGLGGRIVARFRRHVGHDPRLPVISRQGRVIVEADVGKFKREPRSFPIRKEDALVAERMEGKDAMGGRKEGEIRDMR